MLPVPPRNEQDKIVRYLDWKVSQINRLINAKRRQIGLLQEQKQALINAAVTKGGKGWQEVRLGNIGSFRKGYGGSRSDDVEINGVACIRYGDIYRSGVLFLAEPLTRITEESSGSYARVYKDEMLFALSGETKEEIGQAIVNAINEDVWTSGDAAIFKASESIMPRFLAFVLRCPYIVQQRASMAKGDIIVHISTNALRRLRLLVPPIDEQVQISDDLSNKSAMIERAIQIEKGSIDLLHEYRTRLISDVVTGKMDVRGITVPEYETVEEVTVARDETDDGLEQAGDE
jgi:type I restriction enzyme S subunit